MLRPPRDSLATVFHIPRPHRRDYVMPGMVFGGGPGVLIGAAWGVREAIRDRSEAAPFLTPIHLFKGVLAGFAVGAWTGGALGELTYVARHRRF